MNRDLLRTRVTRLVAFERLVFRRIDDAAVRTYSASIAYHAILALTSFSSVMLFMAQVAEGDEAIGERKSRLPADLRQAAEAQAQRIEDLSSTGVFILTLTGLLIGLYGLASGFAALYDALNRIHGTHRYASMTIRYGRALIVALCFTAAFGVALAIVAASTAAGTEFFEGLGLPLIGVLASGFVLVGTVLVFVPLTFCVLLRYGSRARPPWRACAAAGAVSGWGTLLFALVFLGFMALAEPYRLYGAMGTALMILVFAYWASYLTLSCVIFADEFATYAHTGIRSMHRAYIGRDRQLTWRERIRAWRERRRRPRDPDLRSPT